MMMIMVMMMMRMRMTMMMIIEMNLRTLTGLTRGRVRRTPTSAAINSP